MVRASWRSCKHACFVADNIAKHVFRKHYIELFGIKDDLHGGIVYEHIVYNYIAVLRCYILHHFTPEPGSFEHIGFVDQGEFFYFFAGHI